MIEFSNYFIHCVGCGKSWGEHHWLCSLCEMEFLSKVKLRERKISEHITHQYLVPWERGDGLKPLVHSLKGGGRIKVFRELACFWTGPILGNDIFYPSSGKKDHGFELAQALAERHGGKPIGIQKRGETKQALLSKTERKKKQFLSLKKRVFRAQLVDDIVTSGATAEGCWRALGQPLKMTVWSLFYRKSL